jgi:hypothetical protein
LKGKKIKILSLFNANFIEPSCLKHAALSAHLNKYPFVTENFRKEECGKGGS